MSQILCSDIHRTYTVAVVFESAWTGIVPVCRFLSVSTTRAGLRRICLIHLHNRNTEHFGFVGYQGGDFTKRPLVKFLIRTFSVVNVIANTREIPKHNRANIFELAILQKPRGMLVEGIFDLVIKTFESKTPLLQLGDTDSPFWKGPKRSFFSWRLVRKCSIIGISSWQT